MKRSRSDRGDSSNRVSAATVGAGPVRITGRKITSDTLIRVLTNALLYLRNLVFLPVIAKGLGSEAYGVWGQMIGTLGLLTTLLTLNLSTACVRYLPIKTEKREIGSALFSSLAIIWAAVGLFVLIGWFFRTKVSFLMFGAPGLVSYVWIFFVLVLVRITGGFLRNYYRSRNRIKTYSVAEGVEVILEVTAAALLVTRTSMGLSGALWALIAVEGAFMVGMLVAILREVGFIYRLDFRGLRSYLSFSLPLIPNSLLMWVVDLSDRYVITHILGLGQAAAYVAAYQVGRAVSLFMGPIVFGYRPAASSLWDSGDRARLASYMGRALRYYLLFLVPSLFGMFYLAPEAIRVLANEDMVVSPALVLLVGIGIAFARVNEITSYPISLAGRNRIFLILSFFAAAFNLGFNVWLIPKWGILAAATSTLLTYALRNTVVLVISYRILPFQFDGPFFLKAVLCSGAMYGVIRFLPARGIGGLLSVGVVGAAVYFVLMILVRGVSREEWRIVRTALGALFPRR